MHQKINPFVIYKNARHSECKYNGSSGHCHLGTNLFYQFYECLLLKASYCVLICFSWTQNLFHIFMNLFLLQSKYISSTLFYEDIFHGSKTFYHCLPTLSKRNIPPRSINDFWTAKRYANVCQSSSTQTKRWDSLHVFLKERTIHSAMFMTASRE